MNQDVEKVESALQEFDKVGAGLAALKEKFGALVFDVTTSAGMDEAKRARAEIREPRYRVEQIRKDAKAPILALGRKLDADAARITSEILAIEKPIDDQVKAREQALEAERESKVKAEQDRVTGILKMIGDIRGLVALCGGHQNNAAEAIAMTIRGLEQVPVDDSFMEFRQQAEDAKVATLSKLREMHGNAVSVEAAAAEQERNRVEREARINAESERLAQERARLAEEERQAKARRLNEEATAKAAREAEDRKAAEVRAEEKKRQDEALAAQRAVQKAEDDRLAKERADLERQKQEQAKAETERQYQARRASQQKPPDAELIGVLCDFYDQDRERVVAWLQAMDLELAA